ERCPSIHRYGNSQSLCDFFACGTVLHRCVRVHGDAAVTLSSDRNGQRNEFAGLCVELSSLGASVAELAITTDYVGADFANLRDVGHKLLLVGIPVKHHCCTPPMEVGGGLAYDPNRRPAVGVLVERRVKR